MTGEVVLEDEVPLRGMLPAFVDFGLPESACLFVRSDGIDDEYCAPLAVD